MQHTKIFILYTGGTIGMGPKDANDPYSPLEPKNIEELLNYLPGFYNSDKKYKTTSAQSLASRGANFIELDNGNIIEFGQESFDSPVDSSDVSPADWKKMANIIYRVYKDYDGFVILHGTDTMAYTASALSFMLQNLSKPIIVTGSQLPIAQMRTDAVLNFVNSIHIAGYQATDLHLIPEVIIVFADKIIRGCRASKVSTSDWAGFDSPNFPLLGTIGEHIRININYVHDPSKKDLLVYDSLDENVFNISLFPGFTNKQISKLFDDIEIKGYVLRTYGTGNVPSNKDFLNTIGRAVENEKLVVNLSQCSIGTVEMGLYEASNGLMEKGVISGLDITPEAAITKLMWVLGNQIGEGKFTQMQLDQCGEQTENLFDCRFKGIKESKPKSVFSDSITPDQKINGATISNVMLRISELKLHGVENGSNVKLNVFMNNPSATCNTSANDDHKLATLELQWQGTAITRMQNVTYQVQNIIGKANIILTVVTESEDITISYKQMYLTIYAKAHNKQLA